MSLIRESRGVEVPVLPIVSSSAITTSGTSQQTAIVDTKCARIVCTEDCYYETGSNPTAEASTGVYLPANVVETIGFKNPDTDKIAVIQVSTAGIFNVTILDD